MSELAVDTPAVTADVPVIVPGLRRFSVNENRIERLTKDQLKAQKDPAKRSFSKEFAERLATSIENEGLIHPPIVVRKADGTYDVKSGVHRIYACSVVLGWPEIPCFVLDDGEDDLAESIEISANLMVNPLNEPQTRRALERWYALYKKRHPSKKTTTRGTAAKQDAGAVKELASTIGVTETHARNLVNTAKVIDGESRDLLEAAGVSQTKIDQIAKLKEPEAVKTAVNLAAAGQDVDEAIRVGAKVKAENAKKDRKPRAPKEDGAATEEPKPTKKSELTDEDWLMTHCSKIMAVLPFKEAFKQDAILYRRLSEKVIAFRTATKKAIAEAKKPGCNGIGYSCFYKITRMSHPMHWLICSSCDGTGHHPDDKTKSCGACLGGGYKVKFEDT